MIDHPAYTHVTGRTVFVDDLPLPPETLFGAAVYSSQARALLQEVSVDQASRVPGWAFFLGADGIPGLNFISHFEDEPVLAHGEVSFVGQAIGLVAASSELAALRARELVRVRYEPLAPVLTLEEAMATGNRLLPSRHTQRGDVEQALQNSEFRLKQELRTGAQEHWYLETQVCVAFPLPDGGIRLVSSTQNPSEIAVLVARTLALRINQVEVETPQIGGGFGGKETQAAHLAVWAALLANKSRRPVKMRLFRDDDQRTTGKRHPFLIRQTVGFNADGKIQALDVELHADCGVSADLSMAIMDRAVFHSDGSYFIPNVRIAGHFWKTNRPSNTAFRGFGAPQAIAAAENLIEAVARALGKDPMEIRLANFYGLAPACFTPYGQEVRDVFHRPVWEALSKSSSYETRRQSIREFNAGSPFAKRGLAAIPVKFGISFPLKHLNQAGALVNIYLDGSVLVNHGGVEMGQGLHEKVRRVAARLLGLPLSDVRVNATNTSKVPNTSPTAASSGSDLNAGAVREAVLVLRNRIAQVVAKSSGGEEGIPTDPESIAFRDGRLWNIQSGKPLMSFAEAAGLAHRNQISLSSTGYFSVDQIRYDPVSGQGTPFRYFVSGMAVSEIELDVLTGAVKVLRTDILHDAGKSVHPAIDRGQVEGAFVQSLGWCLMEDVRINDKGQLLNHSPDTYKIPTCADVPPDFRVAFFDAPADAHDLPTGKAVGEPPFIYGISVWLAVKDALASCLPESALSQLRLPATPDQILTCLEKAKQAE